MISTHWHSIWCLCWLPGKLKMAARLLIYVSFKCSLCIYFIWVREQPMLCVCKDEGFLFYISVPKEYTLLYMLHTLMRVLCILAFRIASVWNSHLVLTVSIKGQTLSVAAEELITAEMVARAQQREPIRVDLSTVFSISIRPMQHTASSDMDIVMRFIDSLVKETDN